jgi:cytochrome c5
MPVMVWRKLILLSAIGLLTACYDSVSQVAADREVVAADATDKRSARSGEMVYQHVCMACHATGVNDAPKFGDRKDWAELIEEGYGILVYESIKGEGMMPPRGGNPSVTDMEMANAVAYMANAAGAAWVAPSSKEEVQFMLKQAEVELSHHHGED